MGRKYSDEHIKFIKDNYGYIDDDIIISKIGCPSVQTLHTLASKHGVRKRRPAEDLEGEQWKSPKGFSKYEVSNYGRLRNKTTKALVSTRVHEGYYDCRIHNDDGERKSPRIHRFVAECFVDKQDDSKIVVNHKDSNKLNNNASNLEWVTYKENLDHATKAGRMWVNNEAMSEEEAEEICRLIESGLSIRQVMEKNPRFTRARVEGIRQRRNFVRISKHYHW